MKALAQPWLKGLLRLTDAAGIERKYASGAVSRVLQIGALATALASQSRRFPMKVRMGLAVLSVIETGASQAFYASIGRKWLGITPQDLEQHGELSAWGKTAAIPGIHEANHAQDNETAKWNIVSSFLGWFSRAIPLETNWPNLAHAASIGAILSGLVMGAMETEFVSVLYKGGNGESVLSTIRGAFAGIGDFAAQAAPAGAGAAL